MMHDLIDLARQTLSWRGRANRRTFLASIAVLLLLGALATPLVLAAAIYSKPLGSVVSLALGLGWAYFLLGALIRRLHDRRKSGWWLLLFFGPHVVLVSIMSKTGDTKIQSILLAGGLLLDAPFLIWGMVEIFLSRSASGPNVHGPAPADPRELTLVSAQS